MRSRITALLLPVLLLALPYSTSARWSTSATNALDVFPVEAMLYDFDAKPMKLGSGNYLVMCNLGFGDYIDLNHLQLLSPQGDRLWGDGVPVNSDSSHSLGFIISDGAGGAIVTWWQDSEIIQHHNMYGQRLSENGEFLWDSEGVLLVEPSTALTSYIYTMCEDGEGGAYLAWCENGNGDIYAHRIDGNGNAVWSQPIPVSTIPGIQQDYPFIAPCEGGGCYIVWRDLRFQPMSGSATAQRLDPDGNCLWTPDGVDLDLYIWEFSEVLSDGQGGFLYLNRASITRVDENATILWSRSVSTYSGVKFTVDFDMTTDGRIYVAFGDTRDTGTFYYNLYGNCLDLQGHYLWGRSGVNLVWSHFDQSYAYLALTDNGFITAFKDERNQWITDKDVYYIVVDSLGNTVACPNGSPLYVTDEDEAIMSIIPDGENGAIAFMVYNAGQGGGVRANRILSDGTLGYWSTRHYEPEITLDMLKETSYGTIQVTLPENGSIKLEVYNILGQRVSIIEDGYRQAGNHLVNIRDMNLSSGIYLLHLSTPTQSQTIKTLIIR